MESGIGDKKGPRGSLREAVMIFAAVAVVAVVIIAALQIYAAETSKEPFPLETGDWLMYHIEGTVDNVTVGGDFMFYFTETMFGDLHERIVTLSPPGTTSFITPFYSKPLLSSQSFLYDGRNLYGIGDLLATSMSEYDGTNITGMTTGWFGEFVAYEKLAFPMVVSYTNGEATHFINSHNGATLEQWVANGTGLPIMLRYSDENGTDLTLTIAYTNIDWIERMPR